MVHWHYRAKWQRRLILWKAWYGFDIFGFTLRYSPITYPSLCSICHLCSLWERQHERLPQMTKHRADLQWPEDGVELKKKCSGQLHRNTWRNWNYNSGTGTGKSYSKLKGRHVVFIEFLPSEYTGIDGQPQGSSETRFVAYMHPKWGCVARCSVGIVVIRRQSTRKTALCACSQLAMAKRRRDLERRRKRSTKRPRII